MNYKKVFIFLLIFSIMLLYISGCFLSGTTTGPSSPIEPTPINSFSLSHAPNIGETAELSFTVALGFYTGAPNLRVEKSNVKVRAWVEFSYANTKGSYSEAKHAVLIPYNEVLVSGQLAWEGNPFEIDDTLELGGTVQLPREGIWEITGYLEGEGLDNPLMEQTFKEQIRVAVTKDTAAIIRVIQDYTGPLAHLGNFPYGQISERDPDERFDPVILRLDISKIPGVGEEAILSCRIRSIVDAPDYCIQISFAKRLEDNSILKVPGESLLVDGDLNWKGDLKKNEPVEFSATIILPEEGDWQIRALGDCPSNDRLEFADTIKMNITGDLSSYGWEERPWKTTNAPEPAPAPAPIPE